METASNCERFLANNFFDWLINKCTINHAKNSDWIRRAWQKRSTSSLSGITIWFIWFRLLDFALSRFKETEIFHFREAFNQDAQFIFYNKLSENWCSHISKYNLIKQCARLNFLPRKTWVSVWHDVELLSLPFIPRTFPNLPISRSVSPLQEVRVTCC